VCTEVVGGWVDVVVSGECGGGKVVVVWVWRGWGGGGGGGGVGL